MRPIRVTGLAPVTASTTGLNAASWTGAGPFTPTTTACPDGLAHLITLTVATTNYSTTNFTVTGTDADGNIQTEVVAGPNNNTVTSTKHFKTVTSVAVSASLAGNAVSCGYAAESVTKTIPLERRSNFPATHDVDVTGTVNFTLIETFDDVFRAAPESLDWGSYTSGLAAKTATTAAQGFTGASAARIKVNSVTNGAIINWYISQPTQITG